ncbi:Gfo/Idh/MocA family oxidoreductase [Acuticoccus sp. M5D2P5]|uniref:Gfo/Idh/MocA family protein n=1 Tax=Acuticoccus kalidii TaxID=2910977 RepID=UPI001F19592C|nr:Gfo/Idh/MocA family oxidoreductase [Acuticoccus kalidii]MCF3935236.1 Gfo/Idh/MocA family oxidoreductase [Acuticoccus kalidii]
MDKVRYAVVGAGWISQEAFLPGASVADNSVVTAIVSGSPDNARRLADFHGVEHVFGYDRYDEMLAADVCDAVYIALPNSMHADYTIRAVKAGKHALVEKPLAVSVDECDAMIAAAKAAGVHLMTAYRLHCEPGTIAVLEAIRAGEIGTPRVFTSTFTMTADPANHRLLAEHWGGPLQDIGVYCLNAARHVFAAEPVEVSALTARGEDARFSEVEETIGATLRFPGGALAQFTASFGAVDVNSYRVVGTEGDIVLEPGYKFQVATRMIVRKGDTVTIREFPQIDQFGAQTVYFSDCILSGTAPEPDGAEGLADVAIMRALERSAATGAPQPVDLPPRPTHPGPDMVRITPTTHKRLLLS